jgi:hypothetical protein
MGNTGDKVSIVTKKVSGYGYTSPQRRRSCYKVEADAAAAASSRLYSLLLRRRRRLQMKQMQGLLIRMHRNFRDLYLDYN